MTNLLVLDETKRHSELRAQVETVLEQVAPLVRETTRLELPSVVNFRLITPEQWQADSEADLSGLVQRFRVKRPRRHGPAIKVVQRVTLSQFRKAAPLLGGVLVMGATTVGPAEQSITMLVPEALQHSGILSSPEYLAQLISHELTHHAQNLASSHREIWATEKPAALLRAGTIKFLEEGHAHWTDQEVTRLLFGEPKDAGNIPASATSDAYQQALKDKRITRIGPRRDLYKEGLALVGPAVDAVGAATLNRVWTDLSLVPTRREVKHPTRWAARLDGPSPVETRAPGSVG
ncbi:hypothetical protein ABTY00_37095 [Streptomyces microflavus]|uniref:hypothetical protein n=1 Tax=Streptomyces microflavus TaxID=1919 RepID=UPI0033194C18